MSHGLNKVMLIGNLGADPELRYTQAGQAVVNLRIATTETYLDRDKNRKERTDWHSAVLWGARAEALSKILHKGSPLFVEGSLRTSSYDDRDGNKRYRTEVVISEVILLGRGDGAPEEDGSAQPSAEGSSVKHSTGASAPLTWGKDTDGDFQIPFGRAKGQRVSAASSENLQWLAEAMEKDLADPAKAKYRAKTEKRLASIKHALAHGGGGQTGNGASNGGGARPSSNQPDEHAQDNYGGYGGGGYGSDDEIPF